MTTPHGSSQGLLRGASFGLVYLVKREDFDKFMEDSQTDKTKEDCSYMVEKKTTTKAAKKADDEAAVLAAIAAMEKPDRIMGERLHTIILASAPSLSPKLWYNMPAYAIDGKVICFFRERRKFKERYMTFGFNDKANLDEGGMWPIYFALTDLTVTEEARIGELVKKAVSQ